MIEENFDKLVSVLNVYKKGKVLIIWYEFMIVKESNEVMIFFLVVI